MSTIKGIFEPFYDYVQNQLNLRKKIIGHEDRYYNHGCTDEERENGTCGDESSKNHTSEFFKLTTEKQCVIRMASGVDLKEIPNELVEPHETDYLYNAPLGNYSGLARQYVLEGGTQFQYVYGEKENEIF